MMGFPVGETMEEKEKNAAAEGKIWTSILSEVVHQSGNPVQGATVIILGDQHSGKSSLLSRIDKTDADGHGSALEYRILNVQNDFRDGYAYQLCTAGAQFGPAESISLPVWILDSVPTLLKFALPATTPSRAVVCLTASIDNPNLIHSLKRWANTVSEQVSTKYDKDVLNEARKQQERYWQEYVEPVDASMTTSMAQIEEHGLLPLEQGVLTENYGTSFIVVITKSDLGAELSDQQADRILIQVRRFCLQIGAALFYTSSKGAKNVQLLYKYIVHRCFGVPFTTNAQMIERDSLFVPAGWDGEKKIDIIKEGVPDTDVPLEPTRETPVVVKDTLIEAEDEQVFLQRLLDMQLAAPTPQKPQKKAPTLEEGVPADSPLANFFSSLLKNEKAPPSKGPAPSQAESAAHLDRIMRECAKPTDESGSTNA